VERRSEPHRPQLLVITSPLDLVREDLAGVRDSLEQLFVVLVLVRVPVGVQLDGLLLVGHLNFLDGRCAAHTKEFVAVEQVEEVVGILDKRRTAVLGLLLLHLLQGHRGCVPLAVPLLAARLQAPKHVPDGVIDGFLSSG